jgi:hypothetical protein
MARMGEELLHIEFWCKNFESVYSYNTNEVGRFKQRIFRGTGNVTDVKLSKSAAITTRDFPSMLPLKIIPLQTTRMENNWKTEETLARAAVNLETEQIKGSNP